MTSEAAVVGTETRRSGPGIRVAAGRLEVEPHHCFACGTLNTHGLHLELHAIDGRCWTDLTLPKRFEGWEGIAHGGIVATILDEVMAWALVDQDLWGVTARMAIDFRRPVRVGTPIHAEGWIVEARRRIVRAAGRITDAGDGTVLAEADGTFVGASEARKVELQERYGVRIVPTGDASDAHEPRERHG